MAYDHICRYLTTEYPANFVRWLLNIDTNVIEPLPTELSVNPIRSDALYFLPEQQQILKQTSSDAVYVDRFTVANTSHRYRVVRL